ncbi:MAG TPA: transglutaminase-like domain-containing protein [Acidimicrobiales bacterium]
MKPAQRFAQVLALPDAAVPLDEAALLVAACAKPGLDVAHGLARLDDLAAGVRVPTLDGLVDHLFRRLGFTGDSDNYYDPRNSFLDDVIERRLGLPIALSVLTMEVGRRIGVPLWGVGMPGHFLLRDKVDPRVFIDPFHGGQQLDERGCRRLYLAMRGPGAAWDSSFLNPVERRSIVARMLANLKSFYEQAGDEDALAWVLRLRLAIPGSTDDGLALARLLARWN